MDQKICEGCEYSEWDYDFPILNGKTHEILKCCIGPLHYPCELVVGCPFHPSTGEGAEDN